MARYLVTGGAGFIGSNLVDELIEQEHDVVVWDNLTTGERKNVDRKVDFYNVDVSSMLDVYCDGRLDACQREGFDTIFHLAGEARIQPSFENPQLCHASNVTGTAKILEVAKRVGCPVVYAGSSSVYHDPYANPYTFTKFKGEEYCKLYNKVYGVPVAIARFFNVYGPRHITAGAYATVVGVFERQAREGDPLTVTSDGEQRRDFTHVKDIVSGLIAINQNKWNGEHFNLGSGVNYSINELADMFDRKYLYLPERPGEARETLADTGYSKAMLDWEPKMDLQTYVSEFLEKL